MLRADDLNSQFVNGANVINALTNINEAHSADLARKKQAALDRLRFDTEIGALERQRQMELLNKYDDDSIFGGIKELMGKYKTPNPIVANAGGEYLDAQIDALTGQSPVNKVEDVPERREPVKIVRGDVKSYLRKAVNDGTFVKEFDGSYSEMDSQNLNMYKPLVDLAVANGDWKAADMLNRQYMANKRSIDKSWGDKEGRGGVESLFSGPPKTAKDKPKRYVITGIVPIKDAQGNITGYDYGSPREVYLTDYERRNPHDPKVKKVLEKQGVSMYYQSGDLAFNAGESDEAVAAHHKLLLDKGLAWRLIQEYENSAKNKYGVAIVRNSEGKVVKQITKKQYESAKASLLPAE